MRPLAHLDEQYWFGRDYKLFEENAELYDELLLRGETILQDAYVKYMGDYLEPPRMTKSEINQYYKSTLKKKENIMKLQPLPKSLAAQIDEILIDIFQRIKNKDYASNDDLTVKKYKQTRAKLEKKWEKSKEYQNLIAEIELYNEKRYYEYENSKLEN